MLAVADFIQMGVLIIALLALIYQVANQRSEAHQQEERSVNKLTIFFLCQDQPRNEQGIIEHFHKLNLAKKIDDNEIRKAIYEMLRVRTLQYLPNNAFKARRNKAAEDDEIADKQREGK
jgi:hypothetical protein